MNSTDHFRPTRDSGDLFVPDGSAPQAALARTTHLCIAAHPDDAEWIGYHGVAACFDHADAWFTAAIVTDGAGSVRGGPHAHLTATELVGVRRAEQRRAAELGRYAAAAQLGWPSSAARDGGNDALRDELVALLAATRPTHVYVHAPTDRHATHVGVCARALEALRRADRDLGLRPERVLGVEGWGDLDWLAPEDRVALDVSARPHLFAALIGAHDSQIEGGKRYDLAMAARWRANATFAEPRALDRADAVALAVDLTAAARHGGPSPDAVVAGLCERFERDVRERLTGVDPRAE
ncbi:GlcNAc-PI de-N-acetylase [Planctomycetes bacterium Pla163]|uniref:GlcNAc-PI de-N-acetylase n=1 Tax=Rohdeia mirabilis TaxID=2528008 RepID=A0A518CZ99_9BACT|nr:GlcNAc-PI de-N-acetylase [Planctomycetes bacterium Pla163]